MQNEPPPDHAAFLRRAMDVLRADSRFVGLAVGGSYLDGTMDEWSDLDLVIAVEPDAFEQVMLDRREIASRMGTVLTSFTGEHVREPRLLICLYGDPLLHVDLKFVRLPDLLRLAGPGRGGIQRALNDLCPARPIPLFFFAIRAVFFVVLVGLAVNDLVRAIAAS